MRKEKPDLVLLDIMMAYILDGLDVSREMAQDPELKDIPVIMVTSLTGAREQIDLPSDEYIPAAAAAMTLGLAGLGAWWWRRRLARRATSCVRSEDGHARG